jgi:hypothetical protein
MISHMSYSSLIIVNFLGMYTFDPSDVCLLRDFVYPLVRRERNLFPHPFVRKLHDRSEFPITIDLFKGKFNKSGQNNTTL